MAVNMFHMPAIFIRVVSWASRLAILVIAIPLLTLLISWLNSFAYSSRSRHKLQRPPTVPYYLPYIGHGPEFAAKGPKFFLDNLARFGRGQLYKIVLPGLDQFITSGSNHVARVFASKDMSMIEAHARAMERSFGMTPSAAAFYRTDDSGYGPKPLPGSNVKPEHRILLEIHHLVQKNLTGSSLQTITTQFQHSLAEQFSKLTDIRDEWVLVDDLVDFMRTHIMTAALTAMFGPYLISLNPTFVADFWGWQSNMGPLYMGLPRWLIPGAYRMRDKLLEDIMRWHKFARDQVDSTDTGDESIDWEPNFGSRFSRRRQHAFSRFSFMDARAIAAEDLSFIWASNANSGFAAIWYLVELLCDSKLLSRVQEEFSIALTPAVSPTRPPTFDVDMLCSGSLSQSIYAEVLRLKVATLISRKAYKDLDFDGWDLKRGERVCVVSTTEAQDETIWNSGTTEDPHPLDTFWSDRFLVAPNVPQSVPLHTNSSKKLSTANKTQQSAAASLKDCKPQFSLKGLTNSWIPFSGGVRTCPGRHFAKQEIITTVAMMLTTFEIELVAGPGWKKPDADLSHFGFGTMPPNGKIPCRIRRKGF